MVKVTACYIDERIVQYICPFCKQIHQHGSSGDTSNGVIGRFSHCLVNREPVEICVGSLTRRG